MQLSTLTADIECRAWAGLVEVGMRVIGGGFSGVKELGWAQGMEAEVRAYIRFLTICALSQVLPLGREGSHQRSE